MTSQKSHVAKAILVVSFSGLEGLGFRVTPSKKQKQLHQSARYKFVCEGSIGH